MSAMEKTTKQSVKGRRRSSPAKANGNGNGNGNGESVPPGRVIRASGIELFVRERGEGHPLLMINGLGGNVEMWGPAEAALAAGSRLIMFDGPGMGRSGTPFLPLHMPALARVVVSVLDDLGYDCVDLLGYSMGGAIAQQVAKDSPERVRRLALVSTACGWGSVPGAIGALSAIAMPMRYYSRWIYTFTNRLLGESETPSAELQAQAQARFMYPPSLLGYTYLVWAGATWSSLPWLASVECPTLVVTGTKDRLVPAANSVQLAGLLPNSRLHLIPEEAHFLLFGESDAHGLLAEFFASESVDASSAWTTGAVVDEADMRAAMREADGGQPVKALSDAFRWLVDSAGAARTSV
jgi:pimeloyl-ACP methyl ester carboxylesterase